jgi:hypothetical protein
VLTNRSVINEKETVDLFGLVEMLHEHVTEALCAEVFARVREKERQREWSLHALAWFWMSVTLRAPKALSHALGESRRGGDSMLPAVEASSEAFFEKCKDLRPDFFSELFAALGPRLREQACSNYAAPMAHLKRHFAQIWVMDGSQLDQVARKLKITWKVNGAILPGRIMALYDLFRGINQALVFEPDAARNENLLAKEALPLIPEGTLILADRLYGTAGYFQELGKRKLWGLFRRHGTTKVYVLKTLNLQENGGFVIEDLLVEAGCGANGVAKQTLRLIRYREGKKRLELFTNVLDPAKLCAQDAVELYRWRWSVERMFFDLKEVLNLKRFYAGNPNAIAMQVYAAAIVYNAFRIIQGRIARRHHLEPEQISPAKLFPKVAAVSTKLSYKEEAYVEMKRANPAVSLIKPDWRKGGFGTTTLGEIVVRKKKKPRTKGRPNPSHIWKSWRKIRGGAKLLAKLS